MMGQIVKQYILPDRIHGKWLLELAASLAVFSQVRNSEIWDGCYDPQTSVDTGMAQEARN